MILRWFCELPELLLTSDARLPFVPTLETTALMIRALPLVAVSMDPEVDERVRLDEERSRGGALVRKKSARSRVEVGEGAASFAESFFVPAAIERPKSSFSSNWSLTLVDDLLLRLPRMEEVDLKERRVLNRAVGSSAGEFEERPEPRRIFFCRRLDLRGLRAGGTFCSSIIHAGGSELRRSLNADERGQLLHRDSSRQPWTYPIETPWACFSW